MFGADGIEREELRGRTREDLPVPGEQRRRKQSREHEWRVKQKDSQKQAGSCIKSEVGGGNGASHAVPSKCLSLWHHRNTQIVMD